MAIRVAVYDDSRERRESLKYLIDMYDDMLFVGGFEDCSNVEQDVESTSPEVILMDIEMPGANGIEGVKRIKRKYPDIIVLMQTVYEDDESLFDSIKAGASGYLLKKDSPEKIITSIREALEGGAPMSPQMASRVLRFFQQQPTVTNQYALTDREKTILSLLVDGLSYKMIATRENISFHTVNSHVRKIYEKLHVHSMGEAVSKALREGLI
jgi:DNA-binding NarL/FixJ family response regulator